MALLDLLTFITDSSAWGTGKGSPLTKDEHDGNIYSLAAAIQNLIDNPVEGVSVSNISVSGRQVTFHMSDASTFGPFDLPVAQPRFRDSWAPFVSYSAFDIVTVAGYGTYMVLIDHNSLVTFDPDETSSDGALYLKIAPDPFYNAVAEDYTAEVLTLDITYENKYIRARNALGLEVILDAGVFPMNAEITFRAVEGAVTITPGVDVTLNLPEGFTTAQTTALGQIMTVKRVPSSFGEDWDVKIASGGGGGGSSAVMTITDSTLTLGPEHVGKFLRFAPSAGTGCDVTVPDGVFSGGEEFYIFQATGVDPINILQGSTAVGFMYVEGKIASTAAYGAHITMKHVGGDSFAIWGDLMDAPP